MSDLVISNPYVGIAILVVFVLSGKVFRDNWKQKGETWKRNCWLSGIVATLCFLAMAFIPFMPH
ncbi:hypothetical protein [uncultured Cohaesibacter sp.]|uniref:hypothetical protein n=1 Tax=uncultured Cohaesibacter sp. TaxID=1002546 RepID=UPI0029C928DD|nr:hypothetical protein [uncultured Cohaesibacter sp.]